MRPGDEAVELLRALVRIPSVNPAGHPGTDETGEARCAAFLAERLADAGAREVELREVLPGRPNVLARFPVDRPGKPKLLLAPHTDTVSVAGMTIEPFGAELRDGRVYGRGACDTKGTIAAMVTALGELREAVPRLNYELWFAGLMGEEASNEGAFAVASAPEWRADFALVGEPTDCQIVHAHKGATWLLLKTRGRAVHSSAPEHGENAIYKMADVLRYVRDELMPEFAAHPDALLGPATANAGTIQGGNKINIVPDACAVELDLRTLPSQHRPEFVAEITARLRRACADLDVETLRQHAPLYTAPEHPCVRALVAAGGRCVSAPWFCDGSVLASAGGIPAVAAGPGDIAQAHTADEWLDVGELRRGVEFYKRFFQAL